MKMTLLTIAIVIVSHCSYAQTYLPLSGGTLTGTLVVNGAPFVLSGAGSNTMAAGSSATVLGTGSGTDHMNYVYGNNPFTVWTNNINRFIIDGSGNVGIGTTSPTFKLDIIGNFRTTSGGHTTFLSTGAGLGDGLVLMNNASDVQTIQLYTNGASYFNGGNVGIGTTTPDAKLAVNGTIHTKEIKVDLTVPGPDYVFEPAYKLPKLNELKDYLDKNHHLPEIPSADQMAKEGINLGDMNVKLLKKVEELTLYLIEQKEENDKQHKAQQAQINKLKDRMAKLNR